MAGPFIIAWLKRLKVGQAIRLDGPETHLKKAGTPTMGGVLIIFSLVTSTLLWQDLHNWRIWLVTGTLVALGLLGFLDDYLKVTKRNSDGLPAWAKLAGQFVVAIAVALILYFLRNEETTLLYVPFLKNPVCDLGALWVPFAVLLIVGESNAVNLSDGLDGLAAGLLLMVFIALAIISYLSGRADFSEYLGMPYIAGAGEVTIFCLAAVGACVGFLWFNAHPAEVFMGDVGALSLGGVIGVISLIIKKEILVLIIGGMFVLEAASVIIQVISFKLRKKRVFLMSPIHHHFEKAGWDETKVVIRFWILGGLFAIIALSTLKIQ
jgi:phospho-N-acetylmuramoyl-pentapeptide-transferase